MWAWGTLVSQAISELKGCVMVGKWLELFLFSQGDLTFPLKQLLLLVEAKELFTEYGLFLFIFLLFSSFSLYLLCQL